MHKQQFIIGVTGGIGCGKSTAVDLFTQKGIDSVDADIVARMVVEPGSEGLAKLIIAFGSEILSEDGSLNRQELRQLVFTDEKKKQSLNDILHPLIRAKMFELLSETKSQYCLLVAPLLFENKLDVYVTRTLVIDIPEDQQLKRTLARDGSDETIIRNIMKAQISREQRRRLADDVIDNGKDVEYLSHQIDQLHKKYLNLSAP